MNRRTALARLGEFRNEIRWTIVVVVLAVLGAVALWPRDSGSQVAESPGGSGPPAAARPADPARLAELRDRANLEPCAAPQGDPGTAPKRLDGAFGTCMADGSRTDLAATLSEGATLINVWATWCAPCREELPALQAYSEQPGAVRVVGVQVKSDPADGLAMLDRLGVHFPSVHDTNGRLSAALNVPVTLPASYVVTPDGEVRRLPPEVFDSAREVRSAVRQELGGSG